MAPSLPAAFLPVILFFSCTDQTQKEQPAISGQSSISDHQSAIYYCPMHPEVQQNTPGECPKCNDMKLVLRNPENYLDAVLKPVSSSVLANLHITNPQYLNLPVEFSATGTIAFDNYSRYNIASLYSGRLEKLHVRYNFQQVKTGEVVFEIYSPELVTSQENLIYLLKNAPEETELIEAAREKLKLLQLTDKLIREIETAGEIRYSLPVYSPYDGYVLENDPEMTGMQDYQMSPLLSVKEGMYVERGEHLFSVINPHRTVAVLKIKSSDFSKVYKGQEVTWHLSGDTASSMTGKVDFIEPVFSGGSKTLLARVNTGVDGNRYRIGSVITAKIFSDSLETLWAPVSSVMDLGKTKIAWRWNDGYFKAVKVETGVTSADWIEIADGLTEADQIASVAWYLADSESFVKADE